MKRLFPLNVYKLDKDNMFGLSKNSIETCAPKVDALGNTSKVFYDRLVEKTTALGENLKAEKYNHLTQQINVAEAKCDKLISEIRSKISVQSKSVSDETLRDNALEAKRFFEPYKNISKLPLGTQFQVTDEFLSRLNADEEMTALFLALGLQKAVSLLTESNATFKQLWNKRKELMSNQIEMASSIITKREVGKAYTQFCRSLVNDCLALESADLVSLLADLDAIRVKYAMLANHKPKTEEAPTVEDDDTPKTEEASVA